MTAQDTENQLGGAEPAGIQGGPDSIEGGSAVTSLGNDTPDAASDGASETTSPDESAPAADAVPASEDQASTAEPQPDAPPSQAEKLHAAAVAYIIAARVVGVDRVEYLEAKVKEIAD